MSFKKIKVLMVENGSSLYSEEAGGLVLSSFNQAVRGTLFRVDKDFNVLPGLIKHWSWNPSEKSFTLTLDERNRFHDGTKPTSEDLEFSILRGFFSSNRAFYEVYLGNVLGINKIGVGEKYRSGLVNGISIVDELTLKISFAAATPGFLYSLTRPFFSLASRRHYNDDLMTWQRWPIGAGPFMVVDEDDQKVNLKNVTATAAASIDEIELHKRYDSNVEYDLSFYDDRIKNEKIFLTEKAVSISSIFFNYGNELAKDSNFRKSLYYGINRKELAKLSNERVPAYHFLPPNFLLDEKMQDPFDLNLAKMYSAKVSAELRLKKWLLPFSTNLAKFDNKRQKLVDELERQFRDIGYDFSFYPDSDREKFTSEESARKVPFQYWGMVCDYLDPLVMFGIFRSTSAYKFNGAQYDSTFDRLYEKNDREDDPIRRAEYLREVSKYAIDHNFMIPLFSVKCDYYFNPKTIKSLGNQPEPISFDFLEIKI